MKKYILSVLAAGAFWGTTGVFRRLLDSSGLSTNGVVFVRSFFAFVCFAVLLLIHNRDAFKIHLKDLWCFLGTGLISFLLFTLCYFKAMTLMSLSTAAILLYSAPCFVILISIPCFGEKLSVTKVIALVMAFAGCCFVSGIGSGENHLTVAGILFGLGFGICYALYSIFSRFALNKGYSSLTINFWTCLLSTLGSLTSTPAFSAAKATVANQQLEDIVSVGHGIAYLYGVIGVVLFVQIVPKLVGANMEEERAHLVAADTGSKHSTTKKLIEMDAFGFMPFCLAAVIGILVGSIDWGKMIGMVVGQPKWSFALTTTGGCLIVSLIFGHFAHIGPVDVTPLEVTLKEFRELGLMLFLIGAGVAGGASFIKYFKAVYFIYGIIMTTLPLIVGYFFARYVLKLSLLNNLGSITGGMTSTPALGTLISTAGTENVAAAYAATYPMALIAVVVISQVLIIFFR